LEASSLLSYILESSGFFFFAIGFGLGLAAAAAEAGADATGVAGFDKVGFVGDGLASYLSGVMPFFSCIILRRALSSRILGLIPGAVEALITGDGGLTFSFFIIVSFGFGGSLILGAIFSFNSFNVSSLAFALTTLFFEGAADFSTTLSSLVDFDLGGALFLVFLTG
jgi:hypothetical protein